MSEILEKRDAGGDEICLREHYRDWHSRMAALLSPFKLKITDGVKDDMKGLFHTMDYIDQIKEHTCLELGESLDIDSYLVEYFRSPDISLHVYIPQQIKETLDDFKKKLHEKNIQDQYVEIYNQILSLDEMLSTTLNNDEYVSRTIEIGRLYDQFFATLLSDVLDEKAKRFVREFFVGIALADNYEDLADDHAEGRIKIKKNAALKRKFLLAISKQLIKGMRLHPDKRLVLHHVIKYLSCIIKGSKHVGQ